MGSLVQRDSNIILSADLLQAFAISDFFALIFEVRGHGVVARTCQ